MQLSEGTNLDLCPERRGRRAGRLGNRRPAAGASAAPAAAAAGGTLEISAFDLGFEPAQLTVPEPGSYEVKLTNTGRIPHDITFPGGEIATANGGETATVDVDVPAEGLTFICSIPATSRPA